MKRQLIVTFLGSDRRGILSEIATTVNDANCNILDSRQAVFGQDFSLTMIIEGSQPDITRAECMIPVMCQQLDLLSMMKRTSKHEKQNLERLFDIEFSGIDTPGLIKRVTSVFADHNATISAFRQKTFTEPNSGEEHMRCKMVMSVPRDTNIEELDKALQNCFEGLNLTGKLKDTHGKEQDENVASW